MAAEDDINDWAPGQPPPWLAQYGDPSQQQQQLAEYGPVIGAIGEQLLPPSPPAPPPPPPPPPAPAPAPSTPAPSKKTTMGPKGRISTIGAPTTDEVPSSAMPADESTSIASAPPPIDPSIAGAPQPGQLGQAQPSFVPPWIAQDGQPASQEGASLTPEEEGQIEIDGEGNGETREQALTRLLLDPNTPLEGRQRAFAGLTPEQRANVVNTADPKQLVSIAHAAMDPADLATIGLRYGQALHHEQSAERLELARKRDELARRDFETQQAVYQEANAKTVQLEAEAKAISQQKIDPNEHGVGHFIASVLTAAVGGAMSQYTGGRNLALEELDKRTQARIEAQKADIENRWKGVALKRNLIEEHLQRSGDMVRAQMAYHIAQYDRADAELQATQQEYAADGTTNLKIAATRQQIAAQKQAALQAYNKQAIDDGLKQAQTLQALASAQKTQQETVGLQIKQSGMGGTGKAKPVYGTIFNNADFATLPENVQHRGFQLPSKNGQPGGWVLANNDEVAKDASHLVKMYNQADYDLNELQKISVERNGAKSAGGSLWQKWQDTQEQHYQQLLLDVANVYGMMIHGRAPTAGVMDEIIKVAPELKSAWERGDTTALINKFRNDIDNRTSLELQDFTGGAHQLTSARPVPAESNANTIGSDLTMPAIKGDLGYTRYDVRNHGEGIDRLFKEYSENPGLGGSAAFATKMDDVIAAHQKAADTIRADMEKIAAKPKRTSAENAELIADRKALADREEAIRETNDAKKRNVEAEAKRKAEEERAEMEGQAAADDRTGF